MASNAGSICSRPVVFLPEPYNAIYEIHEISPAGSVVKTYRLRLASDSKPENLISEPLHHDTLEFTAFYHPEPESVPEGNNSPWARAKRSPLSLMQWDGHAPTVGQAWTVIYTAFTLRPDLEVFRLKLSGPDTPAVAGQLQAVGLAIFHPPPSAPPGQPTPLSHNHKDLLVIPRSTFWQGAGSPFGPRPLWVIGSRNRILAGSAYPNVPLEYTLTTKFPGVRVHARHPVRPLKPIPGSTIYSRYIPHLKETFSMVALDWQNEEHVKYFHVWQNEPRVAQSWNETGTLEQHREYLRKVHHDQHQFSVLGKFDENYFAYFEIYWAKEDHIGAYYDAGDYDRGRHFLVGEARFRGPHRVKAWHTSLTHYMFLDEPRTNLVVAEPRASGTKVLGYDQANGYYIDKWIDLPHKRAALVKCTRERFFQLCPFEYESST
ncbi:PvdZ protein [Uncinocarpus reesii 1704]|uniref:PvdZ protein n=1 Tax=Uncinocarpus reesii (strain UAMH 1704) TaxID=336963 RepID=C4JLC1_UNCRE|nr:PvdZ protein [Uncinocarpus reesii 1704]EEP78783.1 PvdZ protein [Uncinocarpus reesii 1704]